MNNQCFEDISLEDVLLDEDFLIAATFNLEENRHNAARLPQSVRSVEEVDGVTRLLRQMKCPVELRDLLSSYFQHFRLVNNL